AKHLMGRPEARFDRAMYCPLETLTRRGFPRKEERTLDGSRETVLCAEGTDGHVGVSAKGKRVVAPIMILGGGNKMAHPFQLHTEHRRDRFKRDVNQFHRGTFRQIIGFWATRPGRNNVTMLPPGRKMFARQMN